MAVQKMGSGYFGFVFGKLGGEPNQLLIHISCRHVCRQLGKYLVIAA
jgi:hypothetical protein